jgi:hypothetical protein
MRMGAAMMRYGANPYSTPALTGLIMVALLMLGAIVVQSVGLVEKDSRAIAASERSEARTRNAPANDGRATLDIGVADLRGSLP